MSESALSYKRKEEARADRTDGRRGDSPWSGERVEFISDWRPRQSDRDFSAQKAVPKKRAPAERTLGFLLVAAAAAALIAAAAVLLPPAMRITRYDIVGAKMMSRDEVLSAALIHSDEYFFSVDPEAIRRNLLAEPRIADAQVSRVFPQTLRIAVRERKPVATVLVEGDGAQRVACVDAAGVAFALMDPVANAEALEGLPVVSGFRFEGFRPGTRLPEELGPFFSSLGQVEESEPVLLAAFSEIRVMKPRFGDPELLLYPVQYRIPVRAAAVLNASTLRSIILVLDVIGSRGLAASVAEIDFRTGTVVYRSKEGQSG